MMTPKTDQRAPRCLFYRVVWPDGVIDYFTADRFAMLKREIPKMFERAGSIKKIRRAYVLDHGIKRPKQGE